MKKHNLHNPILPFHPKKKNEEEPTLDLNLPRAGTLKSNMVLSEPSPLLLPSPTLIFSGESGSENNNNINELIL